MRSSCPICDTYMVHAESYSLGCVCPNCGARCRNCLGTDSVIQKGDISRIATLFGDPYLFSQDEHAEVKQIDISPIHQLKEADDEANGKY